MDGHEMDKQVRPMDGHEMDKQVRPIDGHEMDKQEQPMDGHSSWIEPTGGGECVKFYFLNGWFNADSTQYRPYLDSPSLMVWNFYKPPSIRRNKAP